MASPPRSLDVVLTDDPLRAQFLAGTPMRRAGEPEDIACAVLYLVSDASSWVTGKVFEVDGGTESPAITRARPAAGAVEPCLTGGQASMADSIRASVVSSRSCRSRPGCSDHTSSATRAPAASTAASVRGRTSLAGQRPSCAGDPLGDQRLEPEERLQVAGVERLRAAEDVEGGPVGADQRCPPRRTARWRSPSGTLTGSSAGRLVEELAEQIEGLVEPGEEDLFLAGEVAEEGAGRHVRGGGDVVDGRAGEALPTKRSWAASRIASCVRSFLRSRSPSPGCTSPGASSGALPV